MTVQICSNVLLFFFFSAQLVKSGQLLPPWDRIRKFQVCWTRYVFQFCRFITWCFFVSFCMGCHKSIFLTRDWSSLLTHSEWSVEGRKRRTWRWGRTRKCLWDSREETREGNKGIIQQNTFVDEILNWVGFLSMLLMQEWHAQQIASGDARENANFQPLGGDWYEAYHFIRLLNHHYPHHPFCTLWTPCDKFKNFTSQVF